MASYGDVDEQALFEYLKRKFAFPEGLDDPAMDRAAESDQSMNFLNQLAPSIRYALSGGKSRAQPMDLSGFSKTKEIERKRKEFLGQNQLANEVMGQLRKADRQEKDDKYREDYLKYLRERMNQDKGEKKSDYPDPSSLLDEPGVEPGDFMPEGLKKMGVPNDKAMEMYLQSIDRQKQGTLGKDPGQPPFGIQEPMPGPSPEPSYDDLDQLDWEKQGGKLDPDVQPLGSATPGLGGTGPDVYSGASGRPLDPGMMQWLSEKMTGVLPGRPKDEKKKGTKTQRAAGENTGGAAGERPMYKNGSIAPEESFSPNQYGELKDTRAELRTLEQFGATATQLADALAETDATGKGFEGFFEGGLPLLRNLGFKGTRGDIPGAGGVANQLGGKLEGIGAKNESGPIAQVAGSFLGPLGSFIRNTSTQGAKIRQLASTMKLMGSSLMVKGEGQISDWERKMAADAIGMDPENMYADRDIRIGLTRMLSNMRDRIDQLKAEHPQLWETLRQRNHPISRLDEKINSTYRPDAVMEDPNTGKGETENSPVEVQAPDGKVYRVWRRPGTSRGW